MEQNAKKILSKGLGEGYVGNNPRGRVDRVGFKFETSDYVGTEGRYHDEWAASNNGGGQEIIESSDGSRATRVYAGGNLDEEELEKLGLTHKDVIHELVYFVNKSEGKTRLDQDIELTDGEWSYSYKMLKSIKEIPVEVAEEDIVFKGKLVFVHFHINSPVR